MESLLGFLPAVMSGILLVLYIAVAAYLGYRLRLFFTRCSVRNGISCSFTGLIITVFILVMVKLSVIYGFTIPHSAATAVITLMAVSLGFLFKEEPKPLSL